MAHDYNAHFIKLKNDRHLDINAKFDLESQKYDLLVDKLNCLVISRYFYVN